MALGFLATKASSDVLTLSVPTHLSARLSGALEALRVGSGGPREALDALARDLAPTPGAEPPRVTAPRDLLRELLVVAIDEAGEQLSRRCTRLLRGEGSAAEVRAGVAELSDLVGLLAAVEG